jgi:pimeloyl-ACP methyl ester carboxylesterase
MASQISKSEFITIESAGHMTPIENPEIFNKSIKDFLVKNKM